MAGSITAGWGDGRGTLSGCVGPCAREAQCQPLLPPRTHRKGRATHQPAIPVCLGLTHRLWHTGARRGTASNASIHPSAWYPAGTARALWGWASPQPVRQGHGTRVHPLCRCWQAGGCPWEPPRAGWAACGRASGGAAGAVVASLVREDLLPSGGSRAAKRGSQPFQPLGSRPQGCPTPWGAALAAPGSSLLPLGHPDPFPPPRAPRAPRAPLPPSAGTPLAAPALPAACS